MTLYIGGCHEKVPRMGARLPFLKKFTFYNGDKAFDFST